MAAWSDETRAELHQMLDGYLNKRSTKAKDIWYLKRHFTLDPPRSESHALMPIEEVEERLALAKAMESSWWGPENADADEATKESRRLTAFQVSVLMAMPIERLRSLEALDVQFDTMKTLVRMFLQRPLPQDGAVSRKRSRAGTTTSKKKKAQMEPDDEYDPSERELVYRNQKQVQNCLRRDRHTCKVTGTDHAVVCHIVAFSINSTKTALTELKKSLVPYGSWWLGGGALPELARLLTRELGHSDKDWNMLTLNHQLHAFWTKAYFGIKAAGVVPDGNGNATIYLELHWMKRRPQQDPDRKIDLDAWERDGEDKASGESESEQDGTPRRPISKAARWVLGPDVYYGDPAVTNPLDGHDGKVCASIAESGQLVDTGHTFQITMSEEDINRMKLMIDLQWACIQIASMSGAAGWPGFLDNDDDEDADDFHLARVWDWIPSEECPGDEPVSVSARNQGGGDPMEEDDKLSPDAQSK